MSKELTPLEALDFIKTSPYRNWKGKVNTIEFNFETEIKIIETALKEYEGAKEHIKALNKERVENSIKLKAFEIIKKKRVDTTTLFVCFEKYDFETFNTYPISTIGELPLTQEEYELLKEVLGDD